MKERYIKIENNLILDTTTNRVIRNPLVILDAESFLLIDIVDDYMAHFLQSQDNPIKNHILLKYQTTEKDIDTIINNLNGYDYFMKVQDFESLQYHIKHAIGIPTEEPHDAAADENTNLTEEDDTVNTECNN